MTKVSKINPPFYDRIGFGKLKPPDEPVVKHYGCDLFLLLHVKDSYDKYIKGWQTESLKMGADYKHSHAYKLCWMR